MAAPVTPVPPQTELQKALEKAVQGGKSGAMAMTIQCCTLMWMRTTMNYQYRYGTTTTEAMKTLYRQGGIARFYRGLGPALFQGPLSRFGDTAANAGVNAYLQQYDLPVAVRTGAASLTAGLWRISIMPIDCLKTTLQVEGREGVKLLKDKIGTRGPFVLWHGSLAAASATAVGHFPWFFTFNYLNEVIPDRKDKFGQLGRNAVIGFTASIVSDTLSNSLRVVKTTRQTFSQSMSYGDVVRHVVKEDGLMGLFGRGLKTRLLANGIQGLLFSVLYKHFMSLQQAK